MDIKFNSLEELYNRLKPALRTKVIEMHRNGYDYIEESDVWNYLKETVFFETLFAIKVSDILNIDNIKLDEYLKSKLNMTQRHIYFE